MHTTSDSYPYYETSLALPINATSFSGQRPELNISYQYALFTGGKFNRWEVSEGGTRE